MLALEAGSLTNENFPTFFVVKYGGTKGTFIAEFDPTERFMSRYRIKVLAVSEGTSIKPTGLSKMPHVFPIYMDVNVASLVKEMTAEGGVVHAFDDKDEFDRYLSLMVV